MSATEEPPAETGSINPTSEWLADHYPAEGEREVPFETLSGHPIKPLYTEDDLGERDRAETEGLPRLLSLHPRRLSVDVPRPALDDAPVRRLRHCRGDQRALPLPARARPDRPLDRLRHADADGARLRPSALARRGRCRRRRARHGRRHGDPVRGHPARRGHRLDDDQRAGGDRARLLRGRRRGSRESPASGSAARSRPTSSRSTSPRRSGASRSSRRCGWSPT